ncbi:acyl transferase [Altibacter sp.]|uniref:LuxE/PaaK family acyltransferase n=1 Tax=Altibacter sp. TaxID=2024823 RepID=UPI0025839934|nr:acyl transferase [Altibacter sp.]MCW9038810.1 acyl transferase [Altibacter sp.]
MLEQDIFAISSSEDFTAAALRVFQFQYDNNSVYHEFCEYMKVKPEAVRSVTDIPFLPIQFFKSHRIISEGYSPQVTFTSSGTTGATVSSHYVAKTQVYETSFTKAFQLMYGEASQYAILALLPSYMEREGSSLIYMVDHLVKKSHHPDSGFYLHDLSALAAKIEYLEAKQQKTLLIGVSYALLDLLEHYSFSLEHTLVMETGGMKGRRQEMVKEALHDQLKKGFGVSKIHSEYGMTELLSQAYSKGHGIFECPPWMQVLTRDPEDALTLIRGKTGGINVIDLANLYSVSFIATQDLGKIHADGSFEILGRFDNSDIRGCNLMVL